MFYLYFLMGWLVGGLVCSYSLLQILIILFFGIPITLKLNRQGLLKKHNKILKNYLFSLLILLLIFFGILYIVYNLFNVAMSGFIFGVLWALFLGLGKIGKNVNNTTDYLQLNQGQFNVDMKKISKAIYIG